MELRHLRYFVAVAEELHFGRAARRLHIVQPALSQQIQKLERELGVTLLARSRRRVAITPAGEAFLEEARRTLASAREAVDAAHRAKKGEMGRLRVGYVDFAIYVFFPEILRAFRQRYPAVDLQITEMNRDDQLAALDRGTLDVGFLAHREGEGDLRSERVAAEPLVVVLPDTHPLAARETVPVGMLRHEPWVLFPRSLHSRYLELVLESCAAEGFSPRVVQEAGKLSTLAALVGAGFGVTMIPRSVAERPRSHIAVRQVDGETAYQPLDLIWPAGGLSPTAENFLAVTREVRARHAQDDIALQGGGASRLQEPMIADPG
jgi:DNA-binding transcriptional LysR family regulator